MPDHCPKCGKEIEPGEVKCPACGAELPEPGDPAPPQKAAVLAATLLPVFGMIIFLAIAGTVIVAGVIWSRKMTSHHASVLATPPLPPTQATAPIQSSTHPVDATPPVVIPPVPAAPIVTLPTAAAPLPVVPTPAPVPEAIVTPTPPPPQVFPPPSLTGFTPAIVPSGQQLTLQGDSLGRATTVMLFDSHGAFRALAPIVSKTEHEVVVTVPQVRFADHGIYPAVLSPNGMAVLAEQHLGNTPWGTDGHLTRTAVNVRTGDEIVVLDHMLVFAMPDATVSMGDNCVGFFANNVTLKAVGKNCTIYYVDPLQKPDEMSNTRLVKKPSIELDISGDAFRVKPAPPDAENN